MTPNMIVGITIGAAGMGLLIAVLYLWMPRKPERHIIGPCVMPGRVCLMHRSDRYVQDKRITRAGGIRGAAPSVTPEQVIAIHKMLVIPPTAETPNHTETVIINIKGGSRNLSSERVATLIKELNDSTGVR